MTDAVTDLLKAARAAEQAAYAAGTHLQASRSRLAEVVITHKSPADVVSAIDREAETLIRDVVLRQFPGHGFVDEEGGDDAELLADGRPVWVVDPLDGTANYLRGYPQYAVAIALVEAGEPQVGVIYDPSRNEFFGAIRGRGAVLNGEPIRCAKRRAPIESLAATVFPKPTSPRMPVYMTELGRVLRAFSGVRRSGSMALELAYLASGRIDAFWEHDKGPWDAAAATVLLREAGAMIHARDGLPVLASRSLLACTPALFEPFLSLLAEP
ncbi:MAG: inositol monophosphatase [Rhizobiales bacterium]|nr:inositol monophosphatase [Rhizobacter sp.]